MRTFPLTPALKAHALAKGWANEGDSEGDVRKAVARKLLDNGPDKLDHKKFVELIGQKTATPPPAKRPVVKSATPPVRTPPATQRGIAAGLSAQQVQEMIDKRVADQLKEHTPQVTGRVTPESVLSKGGPAYTRIMSASESYDKARKDAICPAMCGQKGQGSMHPSGGMPATYGKATLMHPSDLDKAVSQAFFKYSLSASTHPSELPRWARCNDHDRDLMQWAMRNMAWSGLVGTGGPDREEGIKVYRRKLNDFEVKTLLDDSISGGIEATPVVFDDSVILFPVLYGELFPLVNVKTIARGRRIKSAAINQPSFTSGVTEGSPIQPFNTGSFVTAFDTNIYNAVGAMEIGLDMEEDSPVDMGAAIIEYYGLKALEWLDRVIAVGNGVTEPMGIFNTAGTVSVSSDFGVGGPMTVSDIEGLMFGIAKQFRNEPGSAPVFAASDQQYKRTRGISVGAGDQRRVFGMDHAKYTLMESPFKVQNDIPAGKIAYFNPKRYRMHRRLGLTVRVETGGKQLAQNNTRLIVVRMRIGGQLETGNACAVMTNAKV